MKTALLLSALAGTALAAAQPYDWGDFDEDWGNRAEYESSKALCRALRGREPPAADRPTPAEAAALAGCSSENLYYGIGMPADPVRARHCAFVEAAAEDENVSPYPFTGRAMLMTIYANGRGARRDLDVAIRLACGVEGAPAESHGRVTHLAALRDGRVESSEFHYCDDVTSGLAGGYCAAHASGIEEVRRDAALARMTAGWSVNERAAFAPLREALDAYAEAHANSGDMTGTLRMALWIAARDEALDEFVETIRRLEAREVPRAAPPQFRSEDAALNAAWRRLMRSELPNQGIGGPTRAGLREAQRAWLRYRDAFLAFAAIRWPNVARESLATLLTRRRTELLAGVGD